MGWPDDEILKLWAKILSKCPEFAAQRAREDLTFSEESWVSGGVGKQGVEALFSVAIGGGSYLYD